VVAAITALAADVSRRLGAAPQGDTPGPKPASGTRLLSRRPVSAAS